VKEIKDKQVKYHKEVKNLINTIEKRTLDLAKMSIKVYTKLQITEKVLLRAVMEATEVNVPTTFIILPEKITTSQSINDDDGKTKGDQIISFINALVGNFKNAALSVGYKEVYFYLIDEFTGKLVIPDVDDDIYPIAIQVNVDGSLLQSIAPYVAIGLKFISTVNSITGMINYLGYPVPTIPLDDSTQAFIQKFADGDNSNNSDAAVVTTTRGAALRELNNFYLTFDAKGSFCQLRRVVARTGQFIWTTEENFQKMESDNNDLGVSIADLYGGGTMITQSQITVDNNTASIYESIEDQYITEIDQMDTLLIMGPQIEEASNCSFFFCSHCKNMWCSCCK